MNFILTYEFMHTGTAYIEIDGTQVKFWPAEGLPEYIGDLEGFSKLYPAHLKELVNQGCLREQK